LRHAGQLGMQSEVQMLSYPLSAGWRRLTWPGIDRVRQTNRQT